MQLGVKIFADGADLKAIKAMYANPEIRGFTTNPTLMRAAGVIDYKTFALDVLAAVPDRPVSLEVFADDFDDMIAQGLEIGSWAPNVNVKIPVVNTRGDFTGPVIRSLSRAGIAVNVTAMFTIDQVKATLDTLERGPSAYLSIFAGRIADSGLDPMLVIEEAVRLVAARPKTEIIWASPREVLNVVQASKCGCHIITLTSALLEKLALLGKDQLEFSRETALMFFSDAEKAGYTIPRSDALPAPRRKAI